MPHSRRLRQKRTRRKYVITQVRLDDLTHEQCEVIADSVARFLHVPKRDVILVPGTITEIAP